MSNLVIATFALIDAATVTCATATSAGPTVNMQREQPRDIMRSSTVTPTIKVDFGAVTAFNLIALLFTNAQQTDTWRIRTADTEADLTASPTYDSQVGGTDIDFSPQDTVYSRRHGFLWRSAGWSNRWIQIDIDSTGNADGVFDCGRLCIDNAWQPSRNMTYGVRYGSIDTSPRDRPVAGNTIVNRQGIIPTLAFELKIDDEDEVFTNGHRIIQVNGGSRPILVLGDPDHSTLAHDRMYYGLLHPTASISNDTYRIYSQRYEIEGMI